MLTEITSVFSSLLGWPLMPTVVLGIIIILFVKSPRRAAERLGLAVIALVVTFLGPFRGADPAWPVESWVQEINLSQDFKDVWLAAIGIAVFSASNVLDNLIRNKSKISTVSYCFAIAVEVLYFIFVFCAAVGYDGLQGKILDPSKLKVYLGLVEVVVAACLVIECLIAVEIKD